MPKVGLPRLGRRLTSSLNGENRIVRWRRVDGKHPGNAREHDN